MISQGLLHISIINDKDRQIDLVKLWTSAELQSLWVDVVHYTGLHHHQQKESIMLDRNYFLKE